MKKCKMYAVALSVILTSIFIIKTNVGAVYEGEIDLEGPVTVTPYVEKALDEDVQMMFKFVCVNDREIVVNI